MSCSYHPRESFEQMEHLLLLLFHDALTLLFPFAMDRDNNTMTVLLICPRVQEWFKAEPYADEPSVLIESMSKTQNNAMSCSYGVLPSQKKLWAVYCFWGAIAVVSLNLKKVKISRSLSPPARCHGTVMLGLDKLIQSHKWLQQLVKDYLILFKIIKTSLKQTSESPRKMALKTHWQLTKSVLRVNLPQK